MKIILENLQKEEKKFKYLKREAQRKQQLIHEASHSKELNEEAMQYFGWTTKDI